MALLKMRPIAKSSRDRMHAIGACCGATVQHFIDCNENIQKAKT